MHACSDSSGFRHLLSGIYLCNNEYILALYPELLHRLADRLSDLDLVAVCGSRIYKPHPVRESRFYRIDTGLAVQAVGSQAVYRHFITAV